MEPWLPNESGQSRRGGFPPPVRLTAPLLVLGFGLLATWLNYWLALDANLARDLSEVRTRAASVAARLAAASEPLLSRGLVSVVQLDLNTMLDVPEMVIAGVVDGRSMVVADSSRRWAGFPVKLTSLATTAQLIRPVQKVVVELGENAERVYAACPFNANNGVGWALIELDRRPAMEGARADARLQFFWISGAMALLSFALWAVLHYGYAKRLARLAQNIQEWDTGNLNTDSMPSGGDEVGRLAEDFTAMAARLRAHEEQQLRLEREVLNISESERQRIGHDLHDSLGQRLTAASMTANAMLEAVKAQAPDLAAHGELVTQQLREAIAEARALSHGLAPVTMEAEGLMAALEEMAGSVSRSGRVRCVLDCPQPVRVGSVETGIHLFRIAQEAVNNALKHASASEIRIGLEQQGADLVLEVEDDGSGLDEAVQHEGLGLRVMRYRSRLIGGRLDIGASPAGGTRVSCRVSSPIPS